MQAISKNKQKSMVGRATHEKHWKRRKENEKQKYKKTEQQQ